MQTVKDKTGNTATETLTPKERFERIYRENNGKGKAEKINIITEEIKKEFKTEEQAREFVERNIERLQRNKIVRKTRLARKLNLNKWNYFCTVTCFYGQFLSLRLYNVASANSTQIYSIREHPNIFANVRLELFFFTKLP